MSVRLHYKVEGSGTPLLLIHGLFGNLDNLGSLSRDLKNDYQVIRIDLRNHGLSFHSDEHNYQVMATDVAQLLQSLNLSDVIVVGHSMGGKVAMRLAAEFPELVRSLIIMDMAPVQYKQHRHENVFAGLFALQEQCPATREEAMHIFAQHIEMLSVRQFLGKSLYREENQVRLRFNVSALFKNYQSILDWNDVPPVDKPVLFLKGADSDYITQDAQSAILKQFPKAKAHIIANTGHWLHAEKPQDVLRVIRRFLKSAEK
ncbi:Esterase YbfF [Vibrio aerogenes CECT 7868]|uniref:Esterase YbfF n=1 Tax=Vibrio aerogenes CECT 7868 TaxID=1216006 RepID=A0A1M5W317_9VIBR|nr:alpha/beta fold hydrolase [Vibrio aerogenes]SHH81979.1 Esterase YbfF [Vibrio aerogenes CECT 7868]